MVEFLGVSVLLLVPIIYLVVTFAQIQSASYATDIVAREAARAAVVAGVAALEDGASRSQAVGEAERRASAVAALTMQDFGIDAADYGLTLSCSTSACFAPGSEIRADVSTQVALPGMPTIIGSVGPVGVGVASSSSSPVDDFAGEL